jgi:hypothetical protein
VCRDTDQPTGSTLTALSRGRYRWLTAALAVTFMLVAAANAFAARTGVVVTVLGTPQLERGHGTMPLKTQDALVAGDVIVTDRQSRVKILLADDSVLTIGSNSRLTLEKFLVTAQSRSVALRVLTGRFKLAIATFFGATSDYQVSTPTAVTGVRGTVLWGDTALDAICSLDGQVTVRSLASTAEPAQLSRGQCVRGMRAGPPQPFAPTPDELAGYLKEVTID